MCASLCIFCYSTTGKFTSVNNSIWKSHREKEGVHIQIFFFLIDSFSLKCHIFRTSQVRKVNHSWYSPFPLFQMSLSQKLGDNFMFMRDNALGTIISRGGDICRRRWWLRGGHEPCLTLNRGRDKSCSRRVFTWALFTQWAHAWNLQWGRSGRACHIHWLWDGAKESRSEPGQLLQNRMVPMGSEPIPSKH